MTDTWYIIAEVTIGPVMAFCIWFLPGIIAGLFSSQVKEIFKRHRTRIHAGWDVDLATRFKGTDTILVNLDRMGAMNPKPVIMRRLLLWGAKRYKVNLVPVSFNAIDRPQIVRDTIRLIERKGRECVFTAEDYHGETCYFLSGFDKNEPRPLYFLAQLPRKVTSIKDARQALKPPSVVEAEKQRRTVFRQGDMFAIPTRITTDEILEQGGIIEDRETDGRFSTRRIKARKLYGTAHTATRVAVMPNGTNLAWGKLYHEPLLIGRTGRDHRPCRLRPRRWHLVARNTVPVQKRDPVQATRTHVPPWLLADFDGRW